MKTQKMFSLAAALGCVLGLGGEAVAGTVAYNMDVTAELIASCSIVGSPVMTFSGAALNSTPFLAGDTGDSLYVACTTGTTPTICVDGERTLAKEGTSSTVDFNLSLSTGAASNDLPTSNSPEPQAIPDYTANGAPQRVTLYGRIPNVSGKPAGTYVTHLTVVVNY
jgi:spore coat protein U-like protein